MSRHVECVCPHCRATVELPAAALGEVLPCPLCGGKFRAPLPVAEELPPEVPQTPPPLPPRPSQVVPVDPPRGDDRPQWRRHDKLAAVLGTFITFIAWAWTYQSTGSPAQVLLNYLVLAGWVTGMTAWAGSRWRRGWVRPLVAVAGCGLIVLAGYYDEYTQRWSDPDGDGEVVFIDRYGRWSGSIHYRYMFAKGNRGPNDTKWWSEGPLSPSNKPHGEWKTRGSGISPETQQWYWYGEKITEGEWHLRNK